MPTIYTFVYTVELIEVRLYVRWLTISCPAEKGEKRLGFRPLPLIFGNLISRLLLNNTRGLPVDVLAFKYVSKSLAIPRQFDRCPKFKA